MSKLIDSLIRENNNGRNEKLVSIKGSDGHAINTYVIAKPRTKIPFMVRLKDSIRVLRGKSIAVHYLQDAHKNEISYIADEAIEKFKNRNGRFIKESL